MKDKERDRFIEAIKIILIVMLSYRRGFIDYARFCEECDNIESKILVKYVKEFEGKQDKPN